MTRRTHTRINGYYNKHVFQINNLAKKKNNFKNKIKNHNYYMYSMYKYD